MIYDALIASGKTPIHTPNEFFSQNRAYAVA
jgi:hypothetical protein